ncbi:tRNA modification GTPase [Sphingomonas sp. F9_3S_D5_B_2]
MSGQDTIFALSSGPPPAAVSIIRISGPRAHEAARLIAGELPQVRLASVRELRDPGSREMLDEALVLRFDAPASATGEDAIEFQCHGGRAVVNALLSVLGKLDGLRAAQSGEFTRRAFANGRIDLTEAEGLADLLEAETESQRKAALALAEGGLRREVQEWQSRLLQLSAAAERAIDYDEEDEALDPELLRQCDVMAAELREWLVRPPIERLKDGILVVIAGPPNVGKSSLINAIAGEERAIVTDVPGTTRDHIEVSVAIGGVPIRLTDTAGLRETDDAVEAIGVDRAKSLAEAADVLVWLGQPDHAPAHRRLVLVHSRADLSGRPAAADGTLPVSARTGKGIGELLDRVLRLAREVLPSEGAIAINRRQASLLELASDALSRAAHTVDLPMFAEELRAARSAFDGLTGRSGVEDLLDTLFSRFCLGK